MTTLLARFVIGTPEELSRGRGASALTMQEAADYLEISKSTFRNIVASGEIARVAQFDRFHLFLESDVERLKASYPRHGQQPPAPNFQTTPRNT